MYEQDDILSYVQSHIGSNLSKFRIKHNYRSVGVLGLIILGGGDKECHKSVKIKN